MTNWKSFTSLGTILDWGRLGQQGAGVEDGKGVYFGSVCFLNLHNGILGALFEILVY